MWNRPRRLRRSARRGAVIVEFALVVPFISLIVFGVIDFSKAYGQMNALNSALREGARYGSKLKNISTSNYSKLVKVKVAEYATQYGFAGMDTTKVAVTLTASSAATPVEYITVKATAHPISLQILNRFLGVPALTITRTVVFRYECAGLTVSQCT
jgi:Flp pilus assembly protein TadG